MTKDLAILIAPDAPWMNTQDFLAKWMRICSWR